MIPKNEAIDHLTSLIIKLKQDKLQLLNISLENETEEIPTSPDDRERRRRATGLSTITLTVEMLK